jgi:hypothetical protein
VSGRRVAATVADGWNAFFHRPEPVASLALFRILLGLVLLLNWALLAPDALTWLGERGVLSPQTARRFTGPRLDLFAWMPPSDAWVLGVFLVSGLAALGLTLGYMTRWSALLAFLSLVSMHHRNPLILNSGDSLLRVITFLLLFAPAGAALSVDRWLDRRDGLVGPEPALRAPWALRLIQLQVALLYLTTAWWKLEGAPWRDGTASYYILRLAEFQRFPLPFESLWVESLLATRLLTWASLTVELSMATLVWVPALRYPVLAAAVALHLGLEYTMNIPVFQWLMLACLVTFVPPRDVLRLGRRVRAWWDGHVRPAAAGS